MQVEISMIVQDNRGAVNSQPSGTTFKRDGDNTLWMRCEPGGGVPWTVTSGKVGMVNVATGTATEIPEGEVVTFTPYKAVPA